MSVMECQEILEGCLPLSTLSVIPAYSLVEVAGNARSLIAAAQRSHVPHPHYNEPKATKRERHGENTLNPVEGILAGVPMLSRVPDAIGKNSSRDYALVTSFSKKSQIS